MTASSLPNCLIPLILYMLALVSTTSAQSNNETISNLFPALQDLERFPAPATGYGSRQNMTYCCLQAVNHALTYDNGTLLFADQYVNCERLLCSNCSTHCDALKSSVLAITNSHFLGPKSLSVVLQRISINRQQKDSFRVLQPMSLGSSRELPRFLSLMRTVRARAAVAGSVVRPRN
jgi:hypothetical protein